jgi:8-oxo-dGTP diphosphatase
MEGFYNDLLMSTPGAPYRFCPCCGASLASRLVKQGEPERLVCGGCSFIFYLDPKVAACTISRLSGEIVLMRRGIEPQHGKWVFPGGFVDRGETVESAAVRETREEVCLDVEIQDLVGVYSYPESQVVVVVYDARVIGGELRAGDECLEVRTFPVESIPWEDLAFVSTREALARYVGRRP